MPEPPLLALEKILERKAKELSQVPDLTEKDLFLRYADILDYLRREIYPKIDAGLAALSEHSGYYTLHNSTHFDEVVKYAGLLLGCERGDEELSSLLAYELYVLLVAIRLHDAGNAFGREGHEKRAFQILQQMGELSGPDNFEKRFIADIAEAHGGVTVNGSKDTISWIKDPVSYGNLSIRSRLLAGIVRFADEICESRSRAARQLLDNDALPKHNQVFHKYASCIVSVKVTPLERTVSLKFVFSVDDARRKWGKGKDKDAVQGVYLIDEIFARLEKMFLERRYCDRFMRGVCNIERIRAEIEVRDLVDHRAVIEFAVDEDEDYPTLDYSLREKYKDFTGEELIHKLEATNGSDVTES
jgi:hypothetical protein